MRRDGRSRAGVALALPPVGEEAEGGAARAPVLRELLRRELREGAVPWRVRDLSRAGQALAKSAPLPSMPRAMTA